MITTAFFDAGETLLSPQPSWSGLSTTVLQRRGHDVTIEGLQTAWRHTAQLFQTAADEGRTFSTSHDESHRFWTNLYTTLLEYLGVHDPEAPEELYQTFSDPSNYNLFEDAIPTLEDLRSRGIRLGVISNFESWLGVMLERLGITEFFDVLAISGDLGWEKPDPRIFKWAMDEAGAEPHECLHVGDSPNFDAVPAAELGMTGVLLDRYGRWNDLDGDFARVSTLRDLTSLL
ncbi:MAG: HAD-IA family hydrolase [Actinomycetota bacterium]|nr:HAD-IA family hydrolase [Actinomycetota bacterium]